MESAMTPTKTPTGETLTQRIIRKYEMGQNWGYSAGCTCRGCKAWLRTLRARRKAKRR